ncbi:MAG: DUF6399 domain-containing protein [Leptolyngbyaceae cyanobacterium]
MSINIRERCQKVLQCLSEKTHQSLRAIAAATGIPKSSVHRHLKAMERRQQYAESYLWETVEGANWLRLLVFAVIYCFGIKGGIGAESLSAFFHLVHLEGQFGCSASALRDLEVRVKEQIITYGQTQSEVATAALPISICVGGDETFYELPILVAMELASGFIFTEAACENRTYETWWQQVSQWFTPEQWHCRFLVSDEAKALVKLGLSGLGCPSLPDLFHLLQSLSKSLGSAIARRQAHLQKQLQALLAKRQAVSSPESITQVESQITTLQAQQQSLATDQQDYQHSLHALSQAIHPFHLDTGESQVGLELPGHLQAPLATLERLSHTYAPTQSQAALQRWQRQIPALSMTLHAWWQWALESLSAQTDNPDLQDWVLTALLPWVYWHQQTQKTRQAQLKQAYQQAAQQAQARFLAASFTQTLPHLEQQQWIDWAIWMCDKFQRTSAAIEGRNGYLSALHHANRGFTEQTLKVLTIIHNFDLKRDDGTTAAQRLFGKPFPDLFEFIVQNMGELPRPRRSLKGRKSKKPTVQAVPA